MCFTLKSPMSSNKANESNLVKICGIRKFNKDHNSVKSFCIGVPVNITRLRDVNDLKILKEGIYH